MKYQTSSQTGNGGIDVRRFQKKGQFLAVFFMIGFIVGILYANVVSRDDTAADGIFNEYFLKQYAQTEIIAEDYIRYVLRARLAPILAVSLLGCTKWKKAVVGGTLGWTGFSGGVLAVLAVLHLGMKGLLLCIAGIVPQVFFYVLAYIVLLIYLYHYPKGTWNPAKTVFVTLSLVVGILLETYVNPILMKFIIKIF